MRTLRPEHLRPQSCTLLPNLQQHDWKRFTEIVWKIYRACFCVSKSPTKKVDERRAGLRFALLHDVSGRFAPIPRAFRENLSLEMHRTSHAQPAQKMLKSVYFS